MKHRTLFIFTIVLLSAVFNCACARADTPYPYITESVQANYHPNGTLQSGVTRTGMVEVRLPNTKDVLQYIRLDLSKTQGTNLLSPVAYKDVAASPNPGDRTRMYVNTTANARDISYAITNTSATPVIRISFTYSNEEGGEEIIAGGDNVFNFTVTMNSSIPVTGVSLYFQTAKNTYGMNDATSFYSTWASGGSIHRQDSDGDVMYDRIYWTGALSPGSNVVLRFKGNITPGYNFNENFMYIDLDGPERTYAVYTSTSTFTGITFADRFSRSAVRQGIEMITANRWIVRGFLTNVAEKLDYVIHEWRIYPLGGSTSLLNETHEYYISPGQTHSTGWYDTGVDEEDDKIGYYSAYYDWEVVWGTSYYQGISRADTYLPNLYEIDAWASKSALLESAGISGTVIGVTDRVRHLGHASLECDRVEINSVIPMNSSTGVSTPWVPSGISVRYVSGGTEYDITSGASVISLPASAVSDGYVNVVIGNLTSLVGNPLGQNEDIVVSYILSGPARTTSNVYNLTQHSTLYTLSGTPITRSDNDSVTVPAFVPPGEEPEPGGGGPGGGGGVAANHAEIIKEYSRLELHADNLAGVSVRDRIFDDGDKGVRDIKAGIYIPKGGALDKASLEISLYDSSSNSLREWRRGIDYTLSEGEETLVDGREYIEYNIMPVTGAGLGGLTLYNGDEIEISYNTTIPIGTNFILTRVYGYNWYEDKYMFEDSYEPVRREGYLEDLLVEEGKWVMSKPIIGAPVIWTKRFSVYNPNNVSVSESFSADVFPDTMGINLIDGSGNGKTGLELKRAGATYTSWIMDVCAGCSRDYVLEVSTPPVMETSRYVDVISSNESVIRFTVNITIKNFAEEEYRNVSYIFHTEPRKIISITDGPEKYPYAWYGEGSSEIFVGDMSPWQEKVFLITFEETPPILLTAMNAINYGCSDRANITIIVIPSEEESNSYIEVEVGGPGPEYRTVHAELIEVGAVEQWGEIRLPVTLRISELPSGKYFVYSRFKRDFETILSDQTEFSVDCPEREMMSVSWLFFLVAAIVIVAYLVIRSARRRKHETTVEDLKKKLRSLG